MKYLLITTTGNRNTGDELIRIGVQNLIREIDPSPEFILLDKEKPEQWNNEIEFDKCILCGMPLFWNNKISKSQTIGWWGALIDGWVSKRKNDFLILGAGNVVGKDGILDNKEYHLAILKAIHRAYAVTTRNQINCPGLIQSICPASFAITKLIKAKFRLCNFMNNGAHDNFFNYKESEIWNYKMKELSDFCLDNDFYFIEHESASVECRHEHPEELGWPEDRIFRFNKAEKYLSIYAQSSCYFGNRLHGALMVAALGRPAIGVGYESRLEMIKAVGADALYPSKVNLDTIKSLLTLSETAVPEIIEIERNNNLELLKQFIKA